MNISHAGSQSVNYEVKNKIGSILVQVIVNLF